MPKPDRSDDDTGDVAAAAQLRKRRRVPAVASIRQVSV
jgi:hypothetical protein